MKTFYEQPDMEVVTFEAEDIITTSGSIGDLVEESDNFNGGAIH